MTLQDLIVQQQLEIADLKEKLTDCYDSFNQIHSILFAIGAPLNDNVLEYSKEQRKPLHNIAALLILPRNEDD